MLPIYPSLLCADLGNLESELNKVEVSKSAGLHIDIMDGKFVENKSFDFELTKKIAQLTKISLDLHFMTKNPEQFVLPYLQLKPTRVSVHIEENPSLDFFKNLKEKNILAGIVVDLPTKIEDINPYLKAVDFVVLMSVKCGAGGQSFSPIVLEKIKYVRENFNGDITIDGGINSKTLPLVESAGASSVVMGSAFFTPPQNI